MTVREHENHSLRGGQATSAIVDRLLRLRDVMHITGLSRPTIYRAITEGRFPRPIKFGWASRWSAQEIADHVEQLKAARVEKKADRS